MLCIGAPDGSGPNADHGSRDSDLFSWSVCEFAVPVAPCSLCNTRIFGDPDRVCRLSHIIMTPSWSRSARMPTTRSALSICAFFSCVCCGMEATSTGQSSIGSYGERHHPQHWNAHPSGATVHFIEYFIQRLIEQKNIEQLLEIGVARGEKISPERRIPISAQKFRGHEPLPQIRP